MVSFGLDPAKAPAPVRASKEPIIRLFSWHDAHPIALFMVLLKRFGADFLEWDPHALRKEIVSSFEATSVSELNWNKIEAARTAVLVSSPWSEWHVFEKVVQGLNNNEVDPEVGQPASLPQLMAGVDILSGLDSDMKFSKEVAAYVAACALEAGVIYLPPPLDFAQTMLSEPQYYCRDCKSVGDDILDGRCDNCVGRFKHWDQKISDRPAPAPRTVLVGTLSGLSGEIPFRSGSCSRSGNRSRRARSMTKMLSRSRQRSCLSLITT